MTEKAERKKLAILKVLNDSGDPLDSFRVTDQLHAIGYDISGRTVRYHLKQLDDAGMTVSMGKVGRKITERGRIELESSNKIEKVGFLTSKIDRMTYSMEFDLEKRTGYVVINVGLIPLEYLERSVDLISKVFAAGYAMGSLVSIFPPGDVFGDIEIPAGMVGIGTVCSITLNGVLLSQRIPTNSRFGGLLELKTRKPHRIVEIINYEGTTVDPLEIFIRAGMTDYSGAIANGNGKIGIGFREVPAESRERVLELSEQLSAIGLRGFMTIGWPDQPLLEVPVSDGWVGVIVIGGLNPFAILYESGIPAQGRALAGLADYRSLFKYTELKDRLNGYGLL